MALQYGGMLRECIRHYVVARSKKKNKKVKKRGGGFTKLCNLLARTQVVKQMWNYIRENNLQDPTNKQNILYDDTLRELFGVDTINIFQMNKVLAKHIWPIETNGDRCLLYSMRMRRSNVESLLIASGTIYNQQLDHE